MAATLTDHKPIFSTSSSSSSSSSWSSRAWTYDVFLSFRGQDTRKNFTGHLYTALMDAGVNTFIDDDQLPRGENISKELMQAIQGSRISIIVFSSRYGDSGWCLEELVEIMECRRTVHQLVLPIFYDVDPADVRKQKGSFVEAFERHERRFMDNKSKVIRWREALKEAADLSGWDLRNTANGHEAKFIKQIVGEVSRQLNNTHLFVALNPVGIDFRVQRMTSPLGVGLDDEVRILGIWGLGGIGKTTMAKAIYNKFCYGFEGRSFLANVRETWNVQPNGRVHLQDQLLYDILKSEVKVGSIERGIMVIKQRLCNRRVLIVVDDVDHIDQLNAVARSRDWFGPGSRIIVTTRDRQLLEVLGVDFIYEAEEMNEVESLELFSWHAFRRSHPDAEYIGPSKSIISYCCGLPLALEVLGSFLFRRSKEAWSSALEKLKRIPNNEIKKKLRISFDGLDDDKIKDIFLDISCFFIRMDKDYVLQILDGCDLYAEIGISILLQRCLLTISRENKLMMHDLIRDMGRDLVREKCPKEPGKWSRLWLKEDIFEVVTKQTGTETIEGLTLSMERNSKESFSTKAFEKMQRLRLLQLNYVQLTGSYGYLSKAQLRWLCWHGLPLKFIPNNFYQPNLVSMDLQHSNLKQVWKYPLLLEKLKILNLSHSHYLTRVTPDFSKLPSLTELILKDCKSLCEIHHSIGQLDRLVLVNLEGCTKLKNLPKHFYKLKSVETLNLSGCLLFENLDEDIGKMASLRTLLADNTRIRKVPFSIVQLKNLKHLSLCGLKGSPSKTLTSTFWSWLMPWSTNPGSLLLPSLHGLNSLTTLCLRDCNLTDDGIPEGLGSLRSLVCLDLRNNSFRSLPSSLSGLSKLFVLWLDNCALLQSIPDLPASLFGLFAQNCTALERMPDMSEMPRLCYSVLTNCHKLVDIPRLDKMLTTLKHPVPSAEDLINFSTTFEEMSKLGWQTTIVPLQSWEGSFILPGDDIPAEAFVYANEGSSVHFEVSQTLMASHEFKGLLVCFVYSHIPKPEEPLFQYPNISMINYTQGTTYSYRLYHNLLCNSQIRGNHMRLVFIPSYGNLRASDKVLLTLELGDSFTVKKIGVRLEWELKDVHEDMNIIQNGDGNVDTSILHGDQDIISEDERRIRSKRGLDNDAGTNHSRSIEDCSSKRLRSIE